MLIRTSKKAKAGQAKRTGATLRPAPNPYVKRLVKRQDLMMAWTCRIWWWHGHVVVQRLNWLSLHHGGHTHSKGEAILRSLVASLHLVKLNDAASSMFNVILNFEWDVLPRCRQAWWKRQHPTWLRQMLARFLSFLITMCNKSLLFYLINFSKIIFPSCQRLARLHKYNLHRTKLWCGKSAFFSLIIKLSAVCLKLNSTRCLVLS